MKDDSEFLNERFTQIDNVQELSHLIQGMSLLCMDIIIDKESGDIGQERVDKLDSIKKEYKNIEVEFINSMDTDEEKRNAQFIQNSYSKILQKLESELIPAVKAKASGEIFDKLDNEIDNLATEALQALTLIKQSVDEEVKEAFNTQQEAFKRVYIIVTISVFSFLFTLFLIYYFYRNINFLVKNIVESVTIVKEASGQIADGNQDLASRTQEQASSLEETASTLEEITSTIKQNTDSTIEASRLTNETVRSAQEGSKISNNVNQAMDTILESSKKIAEIVNLVEEIAFQTNILAINAAIEAAKAGEQGKGFAVVAIEVRDLAQRSADAAKDIKNLIESGLNRIDSGAKLVLENEKKIQEITQNAHKVAELMQGMSLAAKEQYTAIEQINKAVIDLDHVTQSNSSLVEEIASSSENLSAEAQKVSMMVDEYLGSTEGGHQQHINLKGRDKKSKESSATRSIKGDHQIVDSILSKKTGINEGGEDF